MIDTRSLPEGVQIWQYEGNESAQVQQFAWIKPANISWISILLITAGSGGGGGRSGASSTYRGGGGAGAAGVFSIHTLPAVLCPDFLYLSLARGGSGGTANNAGSSPAASYISLANRVARNTTIKRSDLFIGSLSVPFGGGAGVTTQGTFPAAASENSSSVRTTYGSFAIASAVVATVPAGDQNATSRAISAGSPGQWINNTNTFSTSLHVVSDATKNTIIVSGGNNAGTLAGGHGFMEWQPMLRFYGGGGGGANATGTAGRGGDGSYGCGGGGGGGGLTGGRGGNGGPAMCLIWAW